MGLKFITTTITNHLVTTIMKNISKHLFMEINKIKKKHSSYNMDFYNQHMILQP